MSVDIEDNISDVGKRMESNTKEAFNTVALDIQRTSADAAPRKEGFLEKNHLNMNYGKDNWEAEIYFRAFNKGFDYAEWTHEEQYNLGAKSALKSGGDSRFAGHVNVGTGYLDRTASQGSSSYISHLESAINDSLG